MDTDHSGYIPYRLDIEPAARGARGASETFVFATESGQDLRLTFTY